MSRKRKLCTVILTRANYARIKCTMRSIQNDPNLELQLVVGGSALLYRYGSVIDIIKRDNFVPNARAYSILDGETPTTMAKSTGLLVSELATIFEQLEPDLVLTVADHFDTMATSLAATYMNIRLAHTQGGEVTGSIDESVRHAITKLAQIHFPATERAKEWIIRMGEHPSSVFMVGCPSIDAISQVDYAMNADFERRIGGVGAPIDFRKPYILVVQHPVTTEYGHAMRQINETLHAVRDLDIQAVWLWPNVDAGSDEISKGIRVFREDRPKSLIHFVRNLPVEDYVRLMYHSRCIVGNSSSGIREAGFLGVPAVNIGTRQNNRERASNVIDVDYDRHQITSAVKRQAAVGKYQPSYLYGDGQASERIAKIIGRVDIPIQKVLTYVDG